MGKNSPAILIKALMGGWAGMDSGGFSSQEEAIDFCSQGEEYFAALSEEEDDSGEALTEDQSQRGQLRPNPGYLTGGSDMSEHIPHLHLNSESVRELAEKMLIGMTDGDLQILSQMIEDDLERRKLRKQSWLGELLPEELLSDMEKKYILGVLSASNPQGRTHSVKAVLSLQERAYHNQVYLTVVEAKNICDEFRKRFVAGEVPQRLLPEMDERNEFDKTGLLPEQVLTTKEKYLLGKSHDGESNVKTAEDAYSEAFYSVENRLGWGTGTVSGLLMFYQSRLRLGLTELVTDLPTDSPEDEESQGFAGDLGLDDQETFLD